VILVITLLAAFIGYAVYSLRSGTSCFLLGDDECKKIMKRKEDAEMLKKGIEDLAKETQESLKAVKNMLNKLR